MDTTFDYAYKLGCGRLIFERNALAHLPDELARLGKTAYIVSGVRSWEAVGARVQSLLAQTPYSLERYAGPCSEEKANELAQRCQEERRDVLVGIGGGRVMDLLKTAADVSGLPVILIPSIAATCAAYTPLSMIYTPDGQCRGTWYFRREADCVLCDISVLRAAPSRYLASGMLDAIAKWVEINHHNARLEHAGQDERTARLLAREIYDDLFAKGAAALGGDESAAEDCLFHNIVTTGMVSGISRGQYQSAMAHGLYEAIRTRFTKESAPFLHGEVVAVGLLAQEYYLGHAQGAEKIKDFMRAAGMPLTLRELNLPTDDASLRALCAQPTVIRYMYNGTQDTEKLLSILKHQL